MKLYLYAEAIEGVNFRKIKEYIEKEFRDTKVQVVRPKNRLVHTQGLLFDLMATRKAVEAEGHAKDKNACHIILTQKLFATLDEAGRPHIRASIYSFPSAISISGIVEGLAKPKDYYLYKQKYSRLGVWDVEEPKVKKKFAGRFIDYGDKRLTEVVKGYIAQGIFFYIFGEPFCSNKACRLYNAHWQEDLIYSQIKSGKLCQKHNQMLRRIKAGLFNG